MSKSLTTEDEFPPSYTESQFSPSSPNHPPHTSQAALLNPLSTHLRTLPSRIRQTNALSQSARADRDLQVLSFILPHVESFLLSSDIAAARTGVAELVVVPLSAVPGRWALSGADERRSQGDIVRVGRVDVDVEREGKEKKKGGSGAWEAGTDDGQVQSADREFDEWGRWDDGGSSNADSASTSLWWKDEAMARRLAAYLQPKEHVRTERKAIQSAVEQQRERKGVFSGWGRKKSDATAPVSPVGSRGPVAAVLGDTDDRVSMTVRAKEVSFRKENDFGVWESLTGSGIVVTIRVR